METLVKLLISFVSVLVAGIPTWVWLLTRTLLEPDGFWQELVVIGLGVWVLGGLQIFFLILLLFWLIAVWTD